MKKNAATMHASLTTSSLDLEESLKRMEQLQQKEGCPTLSPLKPQKLLFTCSPHMTRRDLVACILNQFKTYLGLNVDASITKKLENILADPQEENKLRLQLAITHRETDWQWLVDKLTVHETYFFRDAQQMQYVRHHIIAPLIHQRRHLAQPTLTIWSAGVSTGEEIYSIGLLILMEMLSQKQATLQSNGELLIAPQWQIKLLGTDISHRVLEHAKQGIYALKGTLHSFRDMPQEAWPFFEPQPHEAPPIQEARLRPSVRALANFYYHNLYSDTIPWTDVDLLFCRNVLIYMDENARKQAQSILYQSLRLGGTLVLGSSDTLHCTKCFKPLLGSASTIHQKIACPNH